MSTDSQMLSRTWLDLILVTGAVGAGLLGTAGGIALQDPLAVLHSIGLACTAGLIFNVNMRLVAVLHRRTRRTAHV